jgi:hypothetical protein
MSGTWQLTEHEFIDVEAQFDLLGQPGDRVDFASLNVANATVLHYDGDDGPKVVLLLQCGNRHHSYTVTAGFAVGLSNAIYINAAKANEINPDNLRASAQRFLDLADQLDAAD